MNCRSSVESTQTTSKPAGDVAPGLVWTIPAYEPDGVRHRGSAILFQARTLNCGNLRWRWQAKGTSPQGVAENSDAPPRVGAVRSSAEIAVIVGSEGAASSGRHGGSTGEPEESCRAGLIDENCGERRLRLAWRIPAAGRVPQRMSNQTTQGQATRTAIQAEREPSSLMARNIRLPASTLEDRGHA